MTYSIVCDETHARTALVAELSGFEILPTRVQSLLGGTELIPREGRPNQVIRYAGRIVVRPHRRSIHIEIAEDAPSSSLGFYERMLQKVKAGHFNPWDQGAWVDNASGTRSWVLELGERMPRRSAESDAKIAERWELCRAEACDAFRGVHPICDNDPQLVHEALVVTNDQYEIALVSSDQANHWTVDLAIHDGMDAEQAAGLIRDYSRAWERCKRLNGIDVAELVL